VIATVLAEPLTAAVVWGSRNQSAKRLRARRNLAMGPMVGVDRIGERRELLATVTSFFL
jgi:hypothetical protein